MKIGLTREDETLRAALEESGHEVVQLKVVINKAGILQAHQSAQELKVDMVICNPAFENGRGYDRKLVVWAGGNAKKKRYVVGVDADGTDAVRARGCIMRLGKYSCLITSDLRRAEKIGQLFRTILWEPGQQLDFQQLFKARHMVGHAAYFDNLGRRR